MDIMTIIVIIVIGLFIVASFMLNVLMAKNKENEKKERNVYEKQKSELLRMQEESRDELYHRGQLLLKQFERAENESIEKFTRRSKQIKNGFKTSGHVLKSHLRDSQEEVQRKFKGISIACKGERHNLAREGEVD